MDIHIIYISLSGNTKYFVTRLSAYLSSQSEGIKVKCLNIKDLVRQKQTFFAVEHPFVAFLPTYLEGGNGIDTGFQEILTTDLKKFLTFEHNFKKCLGIIGSGNRNFNQQFCLTAYQYAETFGFPLLDTFELRGTASDVERIAAKILAFQRPVLEKNEKG